MAGKPIEVREGSVSVKIREVKNNGYPAWLVYYYDNTKTLIRVKRSDLEKAKAVARDAARQIASGKAQPDLTPEQQAEYRQAVDLLPEGKTLIEAVANYAKRLDEAVALTPKTFSEIKTEFIEAKRLDNVSISHLKDLKKRLSQFEKSFQGPIGNVTGAFVDDWLRGLSVAPKTRNNYRGALLSFFNFAKARKYLPRDWREMESVAVAKAIPAGPVGVFTPLEAKTLLDNAKPHQLVFLALGCFAGIRHEEIKRLKWEHINFKTGWITLGADVVKRHRTARRRIVPLKNNLKAWLKPHQKQSGPVCKHKNMSNEMRLLAEAAGVQWKHNAPRHSFGSYRLAETQDAAKVVLEMGNSERKFFTNYREVVTEKDAKKWFNVFP